jgi:hypothetical protein
MDKICLKNANIMSLSMLETDFIHQYLKFYSIVWSPHGNMASFAADRTSLKGENFLFNLKSEIIYVSTQIHNHLQHANSNRNRLRCIIRHFCHPK